MDLSEAEVAVTTQKEIDNDTHAGDWFRLSDYGDKEEFYNACRSCFEDEKEPIFKYPGWENIPDILINREWFCPNFFEIRDAMERLDESETEYFMDWCEYHRHNIAIDDPYLLVTRYQENNTSYPEHENESMNSLDDINLEQALSCNFPGMDRYALEIFDDNYD